MILAHAESPFKWPFPPKPKAPGAAVRRRSAARRARPRQQARSGVLTRRAMLADIALVIFWGASIPGLMWLGAAGGF